MSARRQIPPRKASRRSTRWAAGSMPRSRNHDFSAWTASSPGQRPSMSSMLTLMRQNKDKIAALSGASRSIGESPGRRSTQPRHRRPSQLREARVGRPRVPGPCRRRVMCPFQHLGSSVALLAPRRCSGRRCVAAVPGHGRPAPCAPVPAPLRSGPRWPWWAPGRLGPQPARTSTARPAASPLGAGHVLVTQIGPGLGQRQREITQVFSQVIDVVDQFWRFRQRGEQIRPRLLRGEQSDLDQAPAVAAQRGVAAARRHQRPTGLARGRPQASHVRWRLEIVQDHQPTGGRRVQPGQKPPGTRVRFWVENAGEIGGQRRVRRGDRVARHSGDPHQQLDFAAGPRTLGRGGGLGLTGPSEAGQDSRGHALVGRDRVDHVEVWAVPERTRQLRHDTEPVGQPSWLHVVVDASGYAPDLNHRPGHGAGNRVGWSFGFMAHWVTIRHRYRCCYAGHTFRKSVPGRCRFRSSVERCVERSRTTFRGRLSQPGRPRTGWPRPRPQLATLPSSGLNATARTARRHCRHRSPEDLPPLISTEVVINTRHHGYDPARSPVREEVMSRGQY